MGVRQTPVGPKARFWLVYLAAFAVVLMVAGGCAPAKVKSVAMDSGVVGKEVPVAAGSAITARGGVEGQLAISEERKPLTEIEFESQQQSPEVVPGVSAGPVVEIERILVLPSVSSVDQRLMVYAEKLSSWEPLALRAAELDLSDRMPGRWEECFTAINGVFNGYSVLMEALLVQDHPAVMADKFAVDPWLIYQQDIAFLEGGCDQVFISGASLVSGAMNLDSVTMDNKSEADVIQYGEEGRYEDVISAFQNLIESQPGRAVSANTNKMYGLALLRTGNLKVAAVVLSEALMGMSPSHEERALRRVVADLLLATGSLEEARAHYRKLADYFESRKGDDRWVADQLALLGGIDVNTLEFPMYMDVLKGFISFDGQHVPLGMQELVESMEERFRESPLTDQARQMVGQLEDLIREWAAGRLDEVDLLVANNNFVQAKSLLEKMLFDDLPGSVHDTVQRSMDNLLQAEMNYQAEQQAILEQALSVQWDRGVWLLDSQQYDQAIAAFKELLNTVYDLPARANISKAAETASVAMRHKSAGIFVRARNERDYDRKKELLKESWQLLHDITTKYPEVDLIDKVRQNLTIIEKHIGLFDPLMLQELKGGLVD